MLVRLEAADVGVISWLVKKRKCYTKVKYPFEVTSTNRLILAYLTVTSTFLNGVEPVPPVCS